MVCVVWLALVYFALWKSYECHSHSCQSWLQLVWISGRAYPSEQSSRQDDVGSSQRHEHTGPRSIWPANHGRRHDLQHEKPLGPLGMVVSQLRSLIGVRLGGRRSRLYRSDGIWKRLETSYKFENLPRLAQ